MRLPHTALTLLRLLVEQQPHALSLGTFNLDWDGSPFDAVLGSGFLTFFVGLLVLQLEGRLRQGGGGGGGGSRLVSELVDEGLLEQLVSESWGQGYGEEVVGARSGGRSRVAKAGRLIFGGRGCKALVGGALLWGV